MSLKSNLKDIRIFFRNVRYKRKIKAFVASIKDRNLKKLLLESLLNFKDSYEYKDTQRFIRKNLQKISEWINSDLFKMRYAKMPYPPLLNPRDINPKHIDFKTAWSLNLPIQGYYNFYFLSGSFSAHDACLDMLRLCGVQSVPHHNGDVQDFFNQQYELINYRNVDKMHKIIFFINYAGGDFETEKLVMQKFFALTYYDDKKILYIVRDPLQRLKSALNNSYVKWEKTQDFINIESNIELKNRTSYWIERECDFADDWEVRLLDNITKFSRDLFAMDSLTRYINRDNLYYLDFKKTFPQYAFETFSDLAVRFGFNAPNIEHFPTTTKWNILGRILPANIHLDSKFLESFGGESRDAGVVCEQTDTGGGGNPTTCSIESLHNLKTLKNGITIIANPYNYTTRKKINITDILIDSKDLEGIESLTLFVESNLEKDIILQNAALKRRLKEYFVKFCNALKNEIKVVESKFVTQAQILEYLRTHKAARQRLKALLDSELTHIKATRKDIIDTWSDYKDFMDMCEELDSVDS